MRRTLTPLLLCSLAACGAASDREVPAERAGTSMSGTSMSGAIVEAATREAAGMRTNPLTAPLPGGVTPTFTYGVVADLTSPLNATVDARQVALQAQGIEARAAYDAITAQFVAAGFSASAMTEEKGAFVGSFTQGGTAPGMLAVESGGTYVMLIASPAKPGGDAKRDGVTAQLRFTIYTPSAP